MLIPSSRTRSRYAQWPNFPQDPSFFPIAIFLQNPLSIQVAGYDNLAQAAAACGCNMFIAVDDGGLNWPSGFGADNGRMAAIRDAGMYVIAGGQTLGVQIANNTDIHSVASLQALDVAQGAGRTLAAYFGGDEPNCELAAEIAARAAAINGYDGTRPYYFNQFAGAALTPAYNPCQAAVLAAIRASGITGFDFYPFMNPYLPYGGSDYVSVPNDSVFSQGLTTKQMRLYCANPGQPLWAFVECGSDCLRGGTNDFIGGIEDGSNIVVNNSGRSIFTSSWIGLTFYGDGFDMDTVVESIDEDGNAVMSKPCTETLPAATIFVTGGDLNDCVASVNLCVTRGTVYRTTPAQVAAEVWISIINGATGIKYFLHDNTASAYGLGATDGGAGALEAAANLTYINGILRRYGAMLNSRTVGICSMDSMDPVTGSGTPTVASSCSDGILALETSDIAVPGAAIVKSHQGVTYLIAQPSRRGSADFEVTLTDHAGKTATCIWDMNERYDPSNSDAGRSVKVNSSDKFTVTHGANDNHYQAKIYAIN